MSRIGRIPISIPQGVDIEITESNVKAKGPKGSFNQYFDNRYIDLEKDDSNIYVKAKEDVKNANAMHGLYRSLIANAVEGVTKGFSKELHIEGVGYKANISGKKLTLSLGFSHDVVYDIPKEIDVEVDKKGVNIVVSGVDKQLVGLVASQIREFRPPEPYKGKGIRYKDEYVRRKMGKAANK